MWICSDFGLSADSKWSFSKLRESWAYRFYWPTVPNQKFWQQNLKLLIGNCWPVKSVRSTLSELRERSLWISWKTKIRTNPHKILENPHQIFKISIRTRFVLKSELSTPSELRERSIWKFDRPECHSTGISAMHCTYLFKGRAQFIPQPLRRMTEDRYWLSNSVINATHCRCKCKQKWFARSGHAFGI